MNETELKKLTVVQLKHMCKEKNISGYSKLGKNYIIEKLVGWQRSQALTTGNDSLRFKQLDAVVTGNTDASSLELLATNASTPGLGTSLVSTLPVVDQNSFIIANANSSPIIASVAEDNHGSITPTPLNATLISLQAYNGQSSSEKMLPVSRKRPLEGEDSFRSKKTRIDELQSGESLSTPALNNGPASGLRERAKLMLPPKQINHSKADESQSNVGGKAPTIWY